MTKRPDSLERFGRFLMANLRDKAIEHYDLLAKGHYKAPALRRLQADVKALDDSERAVVRRCVISAIDHATHDFLFALQEVGDAGNDIQVLVEGENVAKVNDGLHGELFTEDGWYAKFSAYGEPPESA